jgi:D-alanyl-D-alanine carboxypeptidase (penicillin-binding protein 5/6)
MPWPKVGTAAVAVPQLSVIASSPSQPRVPIASLTKMMSAWVVLHQMPLTYAQRGPCETVRAQDAAVYLHDVATGQSNAKVVQGERICEGTLMRGLLVHSAGNYVELLVVMMHMSAARFIATMNQDASALGLTRTHYVDYTGISPGDLSTARDQATMAIDLMGAEPVVRSIVALSHVALPVAGVVASYTPLVGEDGVVGVKSGFTDPAGGCDVMAVQVTLGADAVTLYAVVLGQHGYDPLGLAGQAALALARALRTSMALVNTTTGRQVRWVGWPGYVVVPPTTTTTTTTTTSTTTTVVLTTTTVP